MTNLTNQQKELLIKIHNSKGIRTNTLSYFKTLVLVSLFKKDLIEGVSGGVSFFILSEKGKELYQSIK
jgi:hypothetical protein